MAPIHDMGTDQTATRACRDSGYLKEEQPDDEGNGEEEEEEEQGDGEEMQDEVEDAEEAGGEEEEEKMAGKKSSSSEEESEEERQEEAGELGDTPGYEVVSPPPHGVEPARAPHSGAGGFGRAPLPVVPDAHAGRDEVNFLKLRL